LVRGGGPRRGSYRSYVYGRLGDIVPDMVDRSKKAPGRGAQPMAVVNSRIKWSGPIHAADFEYLRARTPAVPKITIPGPCAVHFRGGDAPLPAPCLTHVAEFLGDTAPAFPPGLNALAHAGRPYVDV